MEIEKNKNDSRRDLDPKQWGPHIWATLHAIAEGAPENPTPEEYIAYRNIFHALPTILPCEKCRHHAKQRLEATPISYKSGHDLKRSIWDFHNDVNKSLGKPTQSFACCENKEYLKQNNNKIFIILLSILLIMFMIFIAYSNCKV